MDSRRGKPNSTGGRRFLDVKADRKTQVDEDDQSCSRLGGFAQPTFVSYPSDRKGISAEKFRHLKKLTCR